MKALSLWQPWSTAMVDGVKLVETRSWSTKHRGPLAIHASKRLDRQAAGYVSGKLYPMGAVVLVVDLIDVVEMTPDFIAAQTDLERSWGDWRPGRFAWVTEPMVRPETPIPLVGRQGLFEWRAPEELKQLVARAA